MSALERKQTDTLALKTNTHTQATADKQTHKYNGRTADCIQHDPEGCPGRDYGGCSGEVSGGR